MQQSSCDTVQIVSSALGKHFACHLVGLIKFSTIHIALLIFKSRLKTRLTNQCPPPPSHILFTGRMPFLPPNQQCPRTEGDK